MLAAAHAEDQPAETLRPRPWAGQRACRGNAARAGRCLHRGSSSGSEPTRPSPRSGSTGDLMELRRTPRSRTRSRRPPPRCPRTPACGAGRARRAARRCSAGGARTSRRWRTPASADGAVAAAAGQLNRGGQRSRKPAAPRSPGYALGGGLELALCADFRVAGAGREARPARDPARRHPRRGRDPAAAPAGRPGPGQGHRVHRAVRGRGRGARDRPGGQGRAGRGGLRRGRTELVARYATGPAARPARRQAGHRRRAWRPTWTPGWRSSGCSSPRCSRPRTSAPACAASSRTGRGKPPCGREPVTTDVPQPCKEHSRCTVTAPAPLQRQRARHDRSRTTSPDPGAGDRRAASGQRRRGGLRPRAHRVPRRRRCPPGCVTIDTGPVRVRPDARASRHGVEDHGPAGGAGHVAGGPGRAAAARRSAGRCAGWCCPASRWQVHEWAAELARALVGYAEQNARTAEALRRLVTGG